MRVPITMLFVSALAAAAVAQTTDVDWKYYGGAVVRGNVKLRCFYDANSTERHAGNGHVQVWTKCMDQKDMDNFDRKSDLHRKIIEAVVEKIAKGYVPPYAVIDKTVDFDIAMNIILGEQFADLSYVQPITRILYELDCPAKMQRELSISIQTRNSIDTPSGWKYTPPEGNGANLDKLLCMAGRQQ